MQLVVSNHIEFGNKKDVVQTTYKLVGETDAEKALINAMYGLKGTAQTTNNCVYLLFRRTVEVG